MGLWSVSVAWPEDVWESKLDVKVESNKSMSCFMFSMFNKISRGVTVGDFFYIFFFNFTVCPFAWLE